MKFLITAGPTREYIDPVRYISNASSGKMGYELAKVASKKGMEVILITGPVSIKPPDGVKVVNVLSADEMFAKVKASLAKCDIIIGAAAVSDYKPSKIQKHKIKKQSSDTTIELTKNPDILGYLGRKKFASILVGFALETKNLLKSARLKLKEKNLDLIIANYADSIGCNLSLIHI